MKTALAIDTSTLTASVAVVTGTAELPHFLAEAESSADRRVGRPAALAELRSGPAVSQVMNSASHSSPGRPTHSEHLLLLVDHVLKSASLGLDDVDGIAIGRGPGSFTGLRIGMSTAKGLAFAAVKPLWAVSSLAALALGLDAHLDNQPDESPDRQTLVLPILDARRGEVFVGFYRVQNGTVEPVADECVMAPDKLRDAVQRVLNATACQRVIAVGDGTSVHADALGRDGQSLLDGLVTVAAGAPATPPARAVGRLVLSGSHPDVLVDGAPAYIRPSEAEIKFPAGNPGGTFASRR